MKATYHHLYWLVRYFGLGVNTAATFRYYILGHLDVVQVGEHECLFGVEAAGDDVLGVFISQSA
jgi:hypothetical protein